ncbi:MAG: putative porin [Steroidobacteraceae bacterium]
MASRGHRDTAKRRCAAISLTLLLVAHHAGAAATEERSLTELRNTVVNLLQALVERGVVSREQAEAMVRDAQNRAAEETAAQAKVEAAEADAVRVPYVPEIVKDEIRKQVAAELAPQIASSVVDTAHREGWGVPAALPDWARRVTLSADVRVRAQADTFAAENVNPFAPPPPPPALPDPVYLDLEAINAAGGIARAGTDAFANTTEDRQRLRARLRLGLTADLGQGWNLGFRLATGSPLDPVSTNQTLGNYGGRFEFAVDQAYIGWRGSLGSMHHQLDFVAGRFNNPWLASDLIWDEDLAFEGANLRYRYVLGSSMDDDRSLSISAGAFPMAESELTSRDKWLFAGQLRFDWRIDPSSQFQAAVGYYHFDRIAGKRNIFDSNLLDFTAPRFLRCCNTVFDIRNDNDPTTELFALAADYHVANLLLNYEHNVLGRYMFGVVGDYARNIGYDADQVSTRVSSGLGVPVTVADRSNGYRVQFTFGRSDLAEAGAWRVGLGYRYLERDAVLDAFTDSDFRLGGTDVEGFTVSGSYALSPRAWLALRYLSANEIDGPPLGIDVWQLDLNTRF